MTRFDIINRFLRERNFTSFLEIGTYRGEAFRQVRCEKIVSVDPDPAAPATYHMTSDEYFRTHKEKFGVIFIDGLHEYAQVDRDIAHALKCLFPGGVIVLHDCHPTSEKMQEHHTESQYGAPWTGDVWKAFVKARATLPYELYVLDEDMGCGIIDTTLHRTSDVSAMPTDMDAMTYADFTAHPEWMNFRKTFLHNTERALVYAATRNLYHDMAVSARSVTYNGGADRIYFLTEDDTFPEELPEFVTVMNVSGQQYFRHDGPNFKSNWTYMVLLRVALTKLFPQYDRMIHLDVDTIVRKPIDHLWQLDMEGYYYAAVEEKQITFRNKPYFNFGVAVHNLAKLREDGADDTIIRTLNHVYQFLPEQDAVNSVCRRHILDLPPVYNAMWFNKPPVPEEDVIIKHYASRKRPYTEEEDYQYFERMSWDEAVKHGKKVNHA